MSGATMNFRRSPDCEFIRIAANGIDYYQEVKMTTPQNVLHNIEYKLGSLIKLLEGAYEEDDEKTNIYDMCKAIGIEVSEFNERMKLLEDKMNLIIKLLGKPSSNESDSIASFLNGFGDRK
jgi:hypothetical protein